MPNWQPNWNNVRWNWGDAEAAVTALQRMADRLDRTANERLHVAVEAQNEWRGRYRNEFDRELMDMVARSNQLASECRETASRIRSTSQRAYDEQRHREAERRRWQREKEEEEHERRRRG